LAPLPDLLPMRPHFREMVWGGRRLQTLLDKPLPAGVAVGESFELSAYPGRESEVAAGALRGWTLGSLVRAYGARLVGATVWERWGHRFPLLIKLLDAELDLSIQVHPDDAYARRRGLGEAGKTEAWFVLHSQEGRVAYGLQPGLDGAAVARAIRRDRLEEAVRFFPVRAGDVLFIPAGTVHALCRGVVLYEVQQNSDVTFRIYDYGRRGLDGKPRDLHVEQALEVIDFGGALDGPRPWWELPGARPDGATLVDCAHFQLRLLKLASDEVRLAAGDSFLAVTVAEGAARFAAGGGADSGDHRLAAGCTALIPAYRAPAVRPVTGSCVLLLASSGRPADTRFETEGP